MGIDITIHLVKDHKVIARDIYSGRNSEWFMNLQGRGDNEDYVYLPTVFGISSKAPKWDIHKLKEYFYEFYHINVKRYKEWFLQYRPDIDAGWTTTYDKWKYERKGIEPELMHYLPSDVNPADMHFIEITDENNSSRWLYDYLIQNNIPDNADINYWFDC